VVNTTLLFYYRRYQRSRLCYNVASVYLLSVVCDVCIVAKRCVLDQKLLSTAYRKSYVRNRLISKWPWPWPLSTMESHSPLNISETV